MQSLKQLGMSPCTHKDDQAGFAAVIEFVGQQKITTDVTFPVSVPISFQWMIQPLRPERPIIGDQ